MDGGDYARAGWYFITIGADYHKHYFGRLEAGKMQLNELGRAGGAMPGGKFRHIMGILSWEHGK